MKFFYNIAISFFINLPIIWICDYLSGMLAIQLFMPGTVFILLMCRLNKYEGIFAAICLGLVIDTMNFEHHLLGFSCLLLSAPVVLLQKKSWENVFKYRTFFWAGMINLIMQILYISVHLLAYHIPLLHLRFYTVSLLISAFLAGVCGVYLLKFQNKYFSAV